MHIIELVGLLLVYIPAIFIAHTYRKKAEQPIHWLKIIIFYFIGLISVTIPFEFFGEYHKFALFPLGAFVFYIFTRKSSWYTYRPFIWIGFLANYAFFVVSIVIVPIQNAFYPPDELTTYTNSINYANVITTHISGEADVELIDDPNAPLIGYKPEQVDANNWYYAYTETQRFYTDEEFPYMLTDFDKRSGMTKPYKIFINKTGDGLLVITEQRQYYFKLTSSILDFGGEGDA